MDRIEIWTDGSYRPSVDIGGIGVVVIHDGEHLASISGKFRNTTNNQMEMRAIMTALEWVIRRNERLGSVVIHTDSKYCLGVINLRWKRNKNTALWEEFDGVRREAGRICQCPIEFVFTKGHDRDKYNNLADDLARTASGYKVTRKDKRQVNNNANRMIIAIDFDGTVVRHRYPDVGEDIGAVPILLTLQNNGHQFILHTMRDNHSHGRNCLKEASNWFAANHVHIIGINNNPWQGTWTDSGKVFAHLYIDDAALGIPLTRQSENERPYVDWRKCIGLLADKGLLTAEQAMSLEATFHM